MRRQQKEPQDLHLPQLLPPERECRQDFAMQRFCVLNKRPLLLDRQIHQIQHVENAQPLPDRQQPASVSASQEKKA
ncbi:hypothetical protein B5F34_14330 [Mediterranea sp. An20]|nr:hypothetical protein B5F34_14330 [Mediterranea sp. An20]